MRGAKVNAIGRQRQQEFMQNRGAESAANRPQDVVLFKDLYQRCEETIQKAHSLCATLSELNAAGGALSPPILISEEKLKDEQS